jgi:hypothetical protein
LRQLRLTVTTEKGKQWDGRAAYNVLVDLVTALGSDLEGGKVKYTLVEESYLSLLPPALQQDLARIGREVAALAG